MCTYVFQTYPTADITFRFWNRFSGLLKKHSQGLSNEVDRILTTDAQEEGQVCNTDIMVYLPPLTFHNKTDFKNEPSGPKALTTGKI